jgi:hypothetical protein
MPEPLAVWGAVTGTTGLLVAVRRELIMNRRRIRVDHGWRYELTEDDPPGLRAMWIYVMVTNTGRRDIAVEHVGWEWAVHRETLDSGQRIFDAHRAELPLEQPMLLKPDGAPVKFTTPVGPLLALGIDPFSDETWPVAFTHGGNTDWRGPVGCIAQNPPPRIPVDRLRADLERLAHQAEPAKLMGREGLYSLTPEWADRLEGLHDAHGLVSPP